MFFNGIALEKIKIDIGFSILHSIKIGQPMCFSCDKELYFTIDTTGVAYVLDEKLGIKKKVSNSSLIIDENLFIKYEYDFATMSVKYGLFDFEKQIFIWNGIEYNNFFFVEGILFSNTNFYLYKVDINTGNPLWHFSLTTLNTLYPEIEANWEVWHFVGVAEGALWVSIDNNKGRGALLGLETQTGKVLHFIHQVEAQTPLCVFTELPSQGNTEYDAKTHKMIGFYANYYWEIDLHTSPYKAQIWNFEDELKRHYTEFPRVRGSAMNETHIFAFSGLLGNFCKNKVFAFNRQTFQIDWDYELEYVPMKTEITETHLFVLDGSGTLHIFEKE